MKINCAWYRSACSKFFKGILSGTRKLLSTAENIVDFSFLRNGRSKADRIWKLICLVETEDFSVKMYMYLRWYMITISLNGVLEVVKVYNELNGYCHCANNTLLNCAREQGNPFEVSDTFSSKAVNRVQLFHDLSSCTILLDHNNQFYGWLQF